MPPADVVTPRLLRGWPLPEVDDAGDKHARGTVLVVGGSTSTPGAVLLTGLAALRTGAGKLQILTVEATAVALAVAVPEAAVVGLPAAPDGSLSPTAAEEVLARSERASAVVLGPGLLDEDGAGELLRRVLPHLGDTPLLLDGLALRALANDPALLAGRTGLLTPNARELAALYGGEELAAEARASLVAQRYGAVVSAPGWVAAPDGRRWCAWRPAASGWAPRAPVTSWPGCPGGCSPADRDRRRPAPGARTCTPRPVTCSPCVSGGWASWPGSCSTRYPRCWANCDHEVRCEHWCGRSRLGRGGSTVHLPREEFA